MGAGSEIWGLFYVDQSFWILGANLVQVWKEISFLFFLRERRGSRLERFREKNPSYIVFNQIVRTCCWML